MRLEGGRIVVRMKCFGVAARRLATLCDLSNLQENLTLDRLLGLNRRKLKVERLTLHEVGIRSTVHVLGMLSECFMPGPLLGHRLKMVAHQILREQGYARSYRSMNRLTPLIFASYCMIV